MKSIWKFGAAALFAASLAGPAMAQQATASRSTVMQVQQKLIAANLLHGRADGRMGPKTMAAIRAYQQQNNLEQNGQLDPQTLQAMNLAGGGNTTQSVNGTSVGGSAAGMPTGVGAGSTGQSVNGTSVGGPGAAARTGATGQSVNGTAVNPTH